MGDLDEVVARVRDQVNLVDSRAVVVFAVIPADLLRRFEDALVVRMDGIQAWRLESYSGTQKERISTLNRERDILIRQLRLLVVAAPDEALLREVQRLAPDLWSCVDVSAIISPTLNEVEWAVVRDAIGQQMLRRHSAIDLSGLIPSDHVTPMLPLERVYMDLVPNEVPRSVPEGPVEAATPKNIRLVIGNPGAGKTTYLRHLACEYAQGRDALGVGGRLAILIPVEDIAAHRARRIRPLDEIVRIWVEEHLQQGAAVLFHRSSDVLLLFDGLDEVVGTGQRRIMLAAVMELGRRFPRLEIVITARTLIVDELHGMDLSHVGIVRCNPPTAADIEKFLTSFVSIRRPTISAAALVGKLTKDPEFRSLATTPLLLVFLAILDEVDGRLPDRRTALYRRLADLLVDRWEHARRIGARNGGPRLRLGDARRVLGPLAWWMLARRGSAVRHTDLLEELANIERQRGEDSSDALQRANELLRVLEHETALLVRDPAGRWAFVHATLAEYFAGVEMATNEKRRDWVLKDPFRSDLREVVVFCVGELGIRADDERLDVVVHGVLGKASRRGRYDARYPALIAAILWEEPGLTPRQERALLARLMTFMWTTAFSWHAAGEVAAWGGRFMAIELDRPLAIRLEEALRSWFAPCRRDIRWDRNVVLHLVLWHGFPESLARFGVNVDAVAVQMIRTNQPFMVGAAWRTRIASAGRADRTALYQTAVTELKQRGMDQGFIDFIFAARNEEQ